MNSMILSEKLLGHLTTRQKALILEYYRITTSSSLSSDSKDEMLSMINDESKKLDRILRRAEKDTELSMYLDLIDYFCVNAPEDKILHNDKRAYLSEYIGPLVGQEKKSGSSNLLVQVLVECPDGSPFFFTTSIDREKLADAENLADLPELNTEVCNRCNTEISKHRKVLIIGNTMGNKYKT